MRIGIDARMYGSRVTGIGAYVQHLIDALLNLGSGAEFVLFLLPSDAAAEKFRRPGVTTVATTIPWYGWREQLRMTALASRQRCDVVHFPNFNFPLAYRGKFVLTIHDLTPLRFPGPNQQRYVTRRWAYRLLLATGCRRAAAIIAVSRHTAKEITSFSPGCRDRVAVIYPGLSPVFQGRLNYGIVNVTIERYGIRPPYIFHVGVWRDHKNISGLLDAFKILQREYCLPHRLVLAGDRSGVDPPTAMRLAEFSDGSVIAPGFVADHDLPALYHAATVTVVPSHNEGFGLTGIESLACGTPVAASETTSLPEVLGPAGRYFPPNDPVRMASVIASLIDGPERSRTLGAALAIVSRYRWAEAARQTFSLYQKICH